MKVNCPEQQQHKSPMELVQTLVVVTDDSDETNGIKTLVATVLGQ